LNHFQQSTAIRLYLGIAKRFSLPRLVAALQARQVFQVLYFGPEFPYHGVLNCSWRRFSVLALAARV
jgi:hypothetical protein